MRYVKRVGPTGLTVAISALFLGACVRHDAHYEAYRYGSLKDDPIVAEPTKRVAKVQARHRVPVRRARIETEAKAIVASADPAPYVRAPAPISNRPTEPVTEPAGSRKVSIPAAATKSPQTPDSPLPPVDDPAAVAEMLSEGLLLFDEGKVVQARRRFVAAMNGPVPEVLLALARSYDTFYLSRLSTADGAPDMQRALTLYERALERGAKEATPDIERTRDVLKIPR